MKDETDILADSYSVARNVFAINPHAAEVAHETLAQAIHRKTSPKPLTPDILKRMPVALKQALELSDGELMAAAAYYMFLRNRACDFAAEAPLCFMADDTGEPVRCNDLSAFGIDGSRLDDEIRAVLREDR